MSNLTIVLFLDELDELRFQLRYLIFLSTNYKDVQIFPITMLSLLFKENT